MNVHVSRAPPRRTARRPLHEIAAELGCASDRAWAHRNYKATVAAIAREYGLARHLEVGCGRDTLFTPEEAAALRVHVTVNDVSPHELARAPAGFAKICCDISSTRGMAAISPDRFDFVFSRNVLQHVRDVPRLWCNIYTMLAEGGVALAFYPTLPAPLAALNRMVPERLSSALVGGLLADPGAESDGPELPAYYDRCSADERVMAPLLHGIGFREVLVLPFYGPGRAWKSPPLQRVDASLARLARSRDWRALATCAYVVAVK